MDIEVQRLPAQAARVETGVVRFGDDWCGVFLRGDHAFHFAMALRSILARGQDAGELTRLAVKNLAEILESSDERKHVP